MEAALPRGQLDPGLGLRLFQQIAGATVDPEPEQLGIGIAVEPSRMVASTVTSLEGR